LYGYCAYMDIDAPRIVKGPHLLAHMPWLWWN
jgi:hypothetical protein